MKKYLLIFIIMVSTVSTQASDYILKPQYKLDSVIFESDAKLEFIAGKTNNIDGSFTFDMSNPSDSVYGVIRVDLNTLKTSIETRDKHMRELYLETDTYQYAYFEIISIQNLPQEIHPDTVYEFTGKGYFYLHGVKRELEPKLTLEYPSDGNDKQINVTAKFEVLLEDYNIERPKLVLLKVAKQINLHIKFSAFQAQKVEYFKIPDLYK